MIVTYNNSVRKEGKWNGKTRDKKFCKWFSVRRLRSHEKKVKRLSVFKFFLFTLINVNFKLVLISHLITISNNYILYLNYKKYI